MYWYNRSQMASDTTPCLAITFASVIVPHHGEAIGGDIEMLGVRPCVSACVRPSVRPSQSLLAR